MPESDKIYEMIKKMLPKGLVDDGSEEEDEEMSPQEEAEMELDRMSKEIEQMGMEAKQAEAEAKLKTAAAKEITAQAAIAKAEADMRKYDADEYDNKARILEVTERMQGLEAEERERVLDMVLDSLDEIDETERNLQRY